jgi:uncharacterized protein
LCCRFCFQPSKFWREINVAGSSLFALIDDIASILDDVSVMTKVAAKKTAGVLGDDLALNANQVSGVNADRELPVVWAVAKGSFINKVILVPTALLISYFAPWAITPLLMIGGAYLCYEGAEKVLHRLLVTKHKDTRDHNKHVKANIDATVDLVAFEKDKIKGAVRTDFILSAEIIVIALGTVATAAFAKQVSVLVSIGLLMTVGVYGLVAGIVKLDDLGLYLIRSARSASQAFGRGILWFAPWLMKALSFFGTLAMFLVGGSILLHGVPSLAHGVEALTAPYHAVVRAFSSAGIEGIVGFAAGALIVAVVHFASKMRGR